MRIAVCGHSTAGKSEVACWIRDNTNLKYTASTSQAAARVVMSNMNAAGHGYESVEECWSDRHNHQTEWRDIIWAYNGKDGTKLYRDMVAENDVLDGIRCPLELTACREQGLVEVAVWVSAPVPVDPSNHIKPCDCDYVIDNFGGLHELDRQLLRLVFGLRDAGHSVVVNDSLLRQ